MDYMTKAQHDQCHAIIHAISVSAAAQTSGSADLTPLQLTMTFALGSVFGIRLTPGSAAAALADCSAEGLTAEWLRGFLPADCAANRPIAAAALEAIGWQLANRFARQVAA